MGKKGKSGSILNWLLVGGGLFLAYEYFTNKGGQYDFISKGLNAIQGGGASSKYVRGNVIWGDDDYYY